MEIKNMVSLRPKKDKAELRKDVRKKIADDFPVHHYSDEEVELLANPDKKYLKKNPFNKKLFLALVSKGVKRIPACEDIGITEQTLYNWFQDDPSFKQQVEDQTHYELVQDAFAVVKKEIKEGDPDMSKYVLNKTRYWDRRYDPNFGKKDNRVLDIIPTAKVINVGQNEEIKDSLVGIGFEIDSESEFDEFEQILYQENDQKQEQRLLEKKHDNTS